MESKKREIDRLLGAEHPPLHLADVPGYPGDARYVAFHWSQEESVIAYDDGWMSGPIEPTGFFDRVWNEALLCLLGRLNGGSPGSTTERCVLIDRKATSLRVTPLRSAREFLEQQHPIFCDLKWEGSVNVAKRLREFFRINDQIKRRVKRNTAAEMRHGKGCGPTVEGVKRFVGPE